MLMHLKPYHIEQGVKSLMAKKYGVEIDDIKSMIFSMDQLLGEYSSIVFSGENNENEDQTTYLEICFSIKGNMTVVETVSSEEPILYSAIKEYLLLQTGKVFEIEEILPKSQYKLQSRIIDAKDDDLMAVAYLAEE